MKTFWNLARKFQDKKATKRTYDLDGSGCRPDSTKWFSEDGLQVRRWRHVDDRRQRRVPVGINRFLA